MAAAALSIPDIIAKCKKDPSFGLQLLVAMPPILTPWDEETIEIEQEGRKKPKKVKVWSRESVLDGSALVVAYDDEDTASWTWEYVEGDGDEEEDENEEIPGGDGFASPQAAMEAADKWAIEEEILLAPGKPEDYEPADDAK